LSTDDYDSGGGITDKALGAKEEEAQLNLLSSISFLYFVV
jgi:hypothetical protein